MGADTPAAIEKSAGQAQWVLSVKTPAVAGVTPAAIWQHEYRRLGACPGLLQVGLAYSKSIHSHR